MLLPGISIELGDHFWEIHTAPDYDRHSVIFFAPQSRTLISADVLWENGFSVIFQELEGVQAFDETAATLDLIERLSPLTVIPGHSSVFADAASALSRARSRLAKFVNGLAPFPRTVYRFLTSWVFSTKLAMVDAR